MICAWHPDAEREEILNGVRISRVGGRLSQKIRQRIVTKHRAIMLSQIKEAGRLSIRQKLVLLTKQMHDKTWKKVYWPDYACLWYFPACRKAAELIKKYKITRVVSVSFPFTDHLVGAFIKKKNAEVNWIADIIDPSFFPGFSPTNNCLLYSGLNRIIERKIFRGAQAVSVLTRTIQRKYANLYPNYSGKIFINPNLLHYEMATKKSFFPKDDKIRLVFVGTLNKTTRNPEHLLRIFELLLQAMAGKRLELHLFGSIDYCMEQFVPYQMLLKQRIFLYGPVNREKAVQVMHDADILVNIGNANPYQEPSKVIEYASTGKPIVNIITILNDSSALALEKYPAVINILCPIPEDMMTEQINKLVGFIEHPPAVEKESLKKWLNPYTIDAVAGAYLSMLQEVTH